MSDMLKDETEVYVTEEERRTKARFGDKFLARFDYPLGKRGRAFSVEVFAKDEETAKAKAFRLYKQRFGNEATGNMDKFVRYRWASEIQRFCIEKYGVAYPTEIEGVKIEWRSVPWHQLDRSPMGMAKTPDLAERSNMRSRLSPEQLALLGIDFDTSIKSTLDYRAANKQPTAPQLAQEIFVIDIVGEDGDDFLIADTASGYKSRIHKSLIAANGLEVVDGKFNASGTMYGQWFGNAMEKAFEERCELFYSNIRLFVEKRDVILSNPRLYSVKTPRSFCGGLFIGSKSITLGKMLLLWEEKKIFSRNCACGGRGVIHRFGGSPLSGGCAFDITCLACGKQSSFHTGGFRSFMDAAGGYLPERPISQKPVSIEDLIAILKGEKSLDTAADADDVHSAQEGENDGT